MVGVVTALDGTMTQGSGSIYWKPSRLEIAEFRLDLSYKNILSSQVSSRYNENPTCHAVFSIFALS